MSISAALIESAEVCVPDVDPASDNWIIHSHRLLMARPMPIVESDDAEVKKSMIARSCAIQTHPT